MEELSSQSPSPTSKGLAVGAKFLGGRFQIVDSVDHSDFAVAWLNHDSISLSETTLKYLLDCSLLTAPEISEFCEETKWKLFQDKPSVVRVFNLRQPSTTAETIQNLIELAPHEQAAQPGHPIFDVQEIEEWIEILCDTLHAVHLKDVVTGINSDHHGEVYMRDGDPDEIEFIVSDTVDETVKLLSGSPTNFTPAYGSPEQALGSKYHEKQDVYAVGALIYDLLTGRPPFYNGDVLTQIQNVTPPLMSQRRRDLGSKGGLIPQRWEETVAACLSKDPAKRPDFDALITMLFKESGPITLANRKNLPFAAKYGAIAIGAIGISTLSVCSLRDKGEKQPDLAKVENSPTQKDSLIKETIEKSPLPVVEEPVKLASIKPAIKPKLAEPIPTPVIENGTAPEKEAPSTEKEKRSFFGDFRLFAKSLNTEPEPLSLAATETASLKPAVTTTITAPQEPPAQEPLPPIIKAKPAEPVAEAENFAELETDKLKLGESFTLDDLDMEMIWIEPLKIWAAKTEVTQKQFRLGGGTGFKKFQGDDIACDSVTWDGAMKFCEQLNLVEGRAGRLPSGYHYTLPTEAQWKTYVGDADLAHSVHGRSSKSGPSKPGTRKANNFGLVDVRGNLWEWTTDLYTSSNPSKGKALRGGSFVTSASMTMDKNARFYGKEDSAYYQYGFRFVLAPID